MELLKELFLLTAKPFLYVFNVDESGLGNEALQAPLRKLGPLAMKKLTVFIARIKAAAPAKPP